MKVADLVRVLEFLAPTAQAEEWDHVGLLIGDDLAPLYHVLLTIDLGPGELQEAVALGCEAVVAYHPPIFKEVRRLVPGVPAYEAVRAGIAVFSPHTALDVAPGGTNDALAMRVLGLQDVEPLRADANGPGMGKVGSLQPPQDRERLLDRIKQELGVQQALVAGPRHGLVRTAAVCAGSCGGLVDDAISRGIDLYLTGEMRHHDALRAARAGMTVVCVLHSHSERHVLRSVAERMRQHLPALKVSVSEADADPFTIC